jgi:hypothetical protein
MTRIRDLPLLAILPLEKLILHERHDQQRSPGLVDNIRSSGVLRNPPIITPLHDRTGRYMVLDGAHRTLSFQTLGMRHILAQVVEPDEPGLSLHPWNHVIWGLEPEELFESISSIPFMKLDTCLLEDGYRHLFSHHALALIHLADGRIFSARIPANDLVTRVNFLNAIVDRYKDRAGMDRTNIKEFDALKKLYSDLSGLVIFPTFRIEDILYLAGDNHLLPTGSTRFTISPRAMHVNYPLSELEADKSLEEKNSDLQRWLQERLAKKGVRYYAEATFLFDE